MPSMKQMKGTGSTEKALNKIFKKVNRKPKVKTLPKKKARGQTFTVGKKAPAIGSAEYESDLESLISTKPPKANKTAPNPKKGGKKKAPKRYY